MKKHYNVKINREWCKGCEICVNYCPQHILKLDKDFKLYCMDEEKCVGCAICELRCPDFVIQIVEKKQQDVKQD